MRLKTLLSGLEGKERTLFLIITITLCAVILLIVSGNEMGAITSGVIIVIITWIASPIWRPDGYGKTIIRKLSLFIVAIIALPQYYWSNFLIEIIKESDFHPLLSEVLKNSPKSTPSVTILIFVLVAIFIINYLIRDNTVMKEAKKSDIDGYSEKELRKELSNIKQRFKTDLDEINNDTSWSSQYYEPLKAQVEVKKNFKKSRKIMDLLTAIKNDIDSNIFLVIGEPGAGKSVALRKLAEDLLDEFDSTGKLPLYINLKEWKINWSSEQIPTTEQLEKFVTQNVLDRLSVYEQDFLKKIVKSTNRTVFSHLLERGRFFIIFDSFDELPQILDVNESSSLINNLSSTIYKFLNAGINNRGVLSSRYYRMPSDSFRADTELFIRPFTDKQIFSTINKGSAYSINIIKEILNNRPDLSPVLRNPFTCSLLKLYSKTHPNNLPNNQTELYEHYLSTRIDECNEKIAEAEKYLKSPLSKEDLLDISKLIAKELFENHGLEASTETLTSNLESKYKLNADVVRSTIKILEFSKIGRQGKGIDKRFSFVHRRFTEYFIAKTLLQGKEPLPLGSIPNDSRWREALVLVAEVAPDDISKDIADYCWQQIKDNKPNLLNSPKNYFNFIHPLRFLKSAFRGRTNCVEHFQKELGILITRVVEGEHGILTKKCAIEATCILEEKKVNDILEYAFDLRNDWLSETAINSCRNYGNINTNLKERLFTYLSELGYSEFMADSKNLIFNFSLSDAFKKVGIWCRFRQVDGLIYSLGKIIISIIDPLSSFLAYLGGIIFISYFWIMGQLAQSILLTKKRKTKTKNKKSPHYFLNLLKKLKPTPLTFSKRKRNARLRKTKTKNSGLLYNPSTVQMFTYRLLSICILIISSRNELFLTEKIFDFYFFPYNQNFLILILLLFPWFNFILISRDVFMNVNKDFFIALLFITPLMAVIYCLVYLSLQYEFLKSFYLFIGSIFSICFLILLTFRCFKLIRIHFIELKAFKEIKKEKHLTREIIAKEFFLLETRYFREEYVKYLDYLRIKPTGIWPDNKLPNIDNDRSSTYLSQLEERWIGLSGG